MWKCELSLLQQYIDRFKEVGNYSSLGFLRARQYINNKIIKDMGDKEYCNFLES